MISYIEILTDTTATFIHSVPKSTDITAKEYTDGIHIAKMAIKAHNGDLDRGIISVKQEKIMKSGMMIFFRQNAMFVLKLFCT